MNDTIAAISTALGEGAIGIVRISGKDAIELAKKVFISKKKADWVNVDSHRVFYGSFNDPVNREKIDEVLMTVMKAPRTFTREDVVEFNCHGGIVPMRRILETLLNQGARLAEPGEFTRRAFLNGRLDLVQAESIIDIIRAKTEKGLEIAVSQLDGSLSARVSGIQDDLAGVMAGLEVNIDFPEEDVDGPTINELIKLINKIVLEIKELIKGAERGRVYREGVSTIIVGKPNVGKSSLLNALLRENRAIVTEIPGTTRDVIEEVLNIKGIPLRLMDTAGLRATDDIVEKIGVARTRELLKETDLVLAVFDAVTGMQSEDLEILKQIREKKGLMIINKIDLKPGQELRNKLSEFNGNKEIIDVSVTEGIGIEQLEESIEEVVVGGKVRAADNLFLTNIRHVVALKRAQKHLDAAEEGLKGGLSQELIAVDVREAWECVGEITGSTVTEDIVDKIFNDFCIGK